MRSLYYLGLILASLSNPPSDPVKKDLDALQGQWNVERVEIEGKAVEGREGTFTIRGRKMFIGEEEEATLEIDPSCNPKVIDLIGSRRGIKGTKTEGIYKLEGDTMLWCLNIGKGVKNRPLEFRSDRDATFLVIKLRRLHASDKSE